METYKVIFKEGETTGVYAISLVNDPAMDGMFITLSKEEQILLKSVDTEKRIVCGAVLIPDKPIYRNQNGKEFNIVFPAETIQLASEGFFKGGYQQSSTLEHNANLALSGVTVVESWLIEDPAKDKSSVYGFDYPKGTWMASMKIDNPELWNDYIKTGKVKGFSIDGFFDLEKVNLKSELNMSEQKGLGETIIQAIKDGFNAIRLNSDKETEVKLGSVKTADGTVQFNFDGDTIATGVALTMTTPDGEVPVPDGEYDLDGGMHITVLNSIVQEVSTAAEENADKTEEIPPAPATPMSEQTPSIKSEKVTQEVFYQLSKDDLNAMILEFGKIVDEKVKEVKDEFETKLSKATEPIALTKTKPAKEKSFEEMTPLERFRASKLN